MRAAVLIPLTFGRIVSYSCMSLSDRIMRSNYRFVAVASADLHADLEARRIPAMNSVSHAPGNGFVARW